MSVNEIIEEADIIGGPKVISYECLLKLIEQMEDFICKIKIEKEQGTGFFCKIPFPDNHTLLPVLITNNHIINQKILDSSNEIPLIFKDGERDEKIINLKDRMTYTDPEYDTTIIELKNRDNINKYLDIDEIILNDILFDENKNQKYRDETIFIIQYPEGKLSSSFGIINAIFEDKIYNLQHLCSTRKGSSGSPILTLNNKIIGIHKNKGEGNYNLGTFLNYPIKGFIKKNLSKINDENEKLLINFNNRYSTEIIDTEVEEINLSKNTIKNDGIKDLVKIDFRKLKILNLSENNISNMESFETKNYELEVLDLSSNKITKLDFLQNFENLKELNLKNNEITSIKVFGKCKFQNLEKLNLESNELTSIEVLEKCNFENLEELNLNKNEIKNIDILEKVDLKNLKCLYLLDNKISNINILKTIEFDKLEKLVLSKNKIEDANPIFENEHLKELKYLILFHNKISDIKSIEKSVFSNLKILNLRKNKISDISVLENVKFDNLEELYLQRNQIKDITMISEFHLEKLVKLELSQNKIKDINILDKVKFKGLKELYLNDNYISDIEVFEKNPFNELKILDLNKNQIDKNKNTELIKKLKAFGIRLDI